MGITQQQFHTIPTSCAILPYYALCLLVVCIERLWKAVGWVVLGLECMLMCIGSELFCGWLQCSSYTEHGRYGLFWNAGTQLRGIYMYLPCMWLVPTTGDIHPVSSSA